jgi:Zn-dependent protease with chaperone function
MLNVLWNLMEDDADKESQTLAGMLKEHPELPDWSAAVQPVLNRLLQYNGIKRALACRVLSKMPFNAMALSHKTIVIAESLVDFCRGQTHQMAFVVAHEVSHLARGHGRERSNISTVASMVMPANPLVKFGMKALLERGTSRENEFEADRDAATFCHFAGYSAEAGVDFLHRLASGELPKNVLQQLLSTHPPLSERLTELRGHVTRLRTPTAE